MCAFPPCDVLEEANFASPRFLTALVPPLGAAPPMLGSPTWAAHANTARNRDSLAAPSYAAAPRARGQDANQPGSGRWDGGGRVSPPIRLRPEINRQEASTGIRLT